MKRGLAILVSTLVPTLVVVGLPVRPVRAQESTKPAVQSIDVTAPSPPPTPPGFRIEPSMPAEQPGTREQEFYPGYDVKSRHEPAFIAPFVKRVRTSPTSGGRVGLSGWTAPAVPFDIPQATGGLAFGLTFTWGEPVTEKPAPEAGSQR